MVRRNCHTDIEGQPCTGKEELVENTLRVSCQYRIVLQFMGTVITDDRTVQDACAVHGLNCRG